MKKLTPPKEAAWTQKQYSVGEAFDIGTAFFCELWPTFKLELADVYGIAGNSTYRLFVESICGVGWDSYGEWNEAVFRALKIPTKEQVGMKFSPEELFLSTLEFCRLHNERFFKEISLLVELLEGMIADPEEYLFEWDIWTKTIPLVLSFPLHSFNWNTEPRDYEPPVGF